MPRYHEAPVRAGRAFVVVAYRADAAGEMVADLPGRCLGAKPGDACQLRVGFHRDRKTGPCFPVAVLRCATHGRASTLYPPGHVPYGRAAVAPLDPQGALITTSPADATTVGAAWEVTIFAAAADAARDTLWPKEAPDRTKQEEPAPSEDPRRRSTQGRHLSFAAELLGIDPNLDPRSREAIAQVLAVPALELHHAARALGKATLYREEGCIIAAVLAQLRPARGLGDRLHAAGEIAGLWGPQRRWDPGGIEVPRPFRRSTASA